MRVLTNERRVLPDELVLTIARVLQTGGGSGPGLHMEQSPRANLEEPDYIID